MSLAGESDGIFKSIEALIEDVEFQQLNRTLAQRTLFDVLDIAQEERTHSKMLGWLLDPMEAHGLGNHLLRRLLYAAAKQARSKGTSFDGDGSPISPLQAETLSFSDVQLRSEYSLPNNRRLDLIMWSDAERWLCVVENKILSEEGEEQTTSYYDELLNCFPSERYRYRLFVYLSPDGAEPESDRFIPIDYSTIAGLLDDGGHSASDLGRLAIEQYAMCLRGRIVERQQMQEICWRLYRNHRAAVDAIVRYGKTNMLATKTAEVALVLLQKEPPLLIGGRKIEWQSSGGTSNWIAIWPSHWPTRKGYYPGFYKISWSDAPGADEAIAISLGFDKPDGPKVKTVLEQLARERGTDVLEPPPVTAREWADLDRYVDVGARAVVQLITETFLLMEEALRRALPEKWVERPNQGEEG